MFADIDVAEEICIHQETSARITIALTPVENPCEFGIARVDETCRISEFKEKPTPEEVFSNLINAGVYVMEREVLSHVPKDSFFDFSKDLVPIVMLEGGLIQGYNLDGIWMDVGRPHDLLGANLAVASSEYAGAEWGAKDACIRGDFYMGPGSEVANSEMTSSVVLSGSRVVDSRLDRVLVMRGCSIDGAHLVNTIVGDGCRIGFGAKVSNAVLADNTVVAPGDILDGGRIVRSELFRRFDLIPCIHVCIAPSNVSLGIRTSFGFQSHRIQHFERMES